MTGKRFDEISEGDPDALVADHLQGMIVEATP